MTAPIRITRNPEEFELYRIVGDYEALQDGFLDRIDDLNTTMALPSFADGQVQKLLTKNAGKAIARPRDHRSASAKRTFGWESLAKMLRDTGLALVLVVDDARFEPIKEQLAKRRRRREPANARSTRPTWLFTKKKAREMGTKRFSTMTESQRKRLARKAGKASGRARRRKARASGALLASAIPPSSPHGHSTPNTQTGCCSPARDQAPL